MGIWNTSASPIGYAYQSNKGPGINIKPIDPRAFVVDSGNSTTQRSGSGGSGSNFEFKNKDILDGTNTLLYDYANTIDSKLSQLIPTYTQKILSERDPKKVEALQQEYAQESNKYFQMKNSLLVTNQNAKFQFDKWTNTQKEVNDKNIGSEIALANPLAGTISSGDELFNMIASGKNPYQMIWSKNKSGKLEGELLTNNKFLDYYNENSGIELDGQGRVRATTFEAPVTKMNNFMETKNEITSKVDKTVANNIINGITEEVNNGSNTHTKTVNQNITSVNEGLKASWDALSEGSRSYMLSNVLNGDIRLDNGTKDGEWLSGSKAVTEVEVNLNIWRSDKYTKEEQEKALKKATAITDAIVRQAKINVHNIAAGHAIGQTHNYKNEGLTTNRNAAGEIIDDRNTSAIDAVYGKFANVGETEMVARNPITNAVSSQGNIPMRSLQMSIDETRLFSTQLLDKGTAEKGMYADIKNVAMGIVGGITFKPNALYGNNEDIKVIAILPNAIQVPGFKGIVSSPNGWQYTDMKYDKDKNRMPSNYSLATVQVTSDTPVPVTGPDGNTILKPIYKLNPEEAKKIGAVMSTTENPKSKWTNWHDNNMWNYNMYIPAPSKNASDGRNTINRQNTIDRANNMKQVDAVQQGDASFTQERQSYLKQKNEDLMLARKSNSNVSIISNNGKAYTGKTPNEKLESIQKVNKLDTRNRFDKYDMTTEAVYKLYNEGAITNDDVIDILNLAKKQKDLNDALSSGLNN